MIVDIFRPFISSPRRATPIHVSATPHASPEGIYAASVNQLKRLLLVHRLNCSKMGVASPFSHIPILYVMNALVHEASSIAVRQGGSAAMPTEWQFYLDLCLTSYQSMFESFRTFGSAAKGMMAMALRHGVITTRRAERGAAEMQEIGRKYDIAKDLGDERVAWIVDQDLGMTDSEAAGGTSLADGLQKLIIHDDTETTDKETMAKE
jgi:hypothetical protein